MGAARRAAIVVALAAGWSCEPAAPIVPVPSAIVVSPSTRTVTALRQTDRYTATVLGERGDTIQGALVRWGSTDPAVAMVTDSGDVTSTGQGSALITASFSGLVGSARITVSQISAQLYPMEGNGQSGTVSRPLPFKVVVRVIDSAGAPVARVPVAFTASSGGSAAAVPASTDAVGEVSAVWTLGETPGTQLLSATVAGVAPLTFRATAVSNGDLLPDSVSKETSDAACVSDSSPVQPAPTVRVWDQFGMPLGGASVTFWVTGGTGDVTGSIQQTNSRGLATVGAWVPKVAGVNSLTATVSTPVEGRSVTFVANVVASSPRPDSAMRQTAPLTVGPQGIVGPRPALRVLDQLGNPLPNVRVTFVATRGLSFASFPDQLTDPQGVATVGAWILQALGTHELTATVSTDESACTIRGNPVTFYVTWP